jgi:hypothetical protein
MKYKRALMKGQTTSDSGLKHRLKLMIYIALQHNRKAVLLTTGTRPISYETSLRDLRVPFVLLRNHRGVGGGS